MLVAEESQVSMNFIAENNDAMQMTDGIEPKERFGPPSNASRVVWITENEELATINDGEKVFEVHFVERVTLALLERVDYDLPSIALDSHAKRVIDGSLDDNLVSRDSKSVDGHADTLDDARDVG